MKTFVKKGIIYPYSSRDKSYITKYQIDKEYPEYYEKLKFIYTSGYYNEALQEIAKSVNNYLVVHGLLSWKQFDMIMNAKRVVIGIKKRFPTQAQNMISRDFYTERVFKTLIHDAQNKFHHQFGMDDDYEALGGWLNSNEFNDLF